jgi:transposase
LIQIQISSKKEREERVLDLHFNQNKNYRQIAQEMKMSLRDIGEIVNRAKQEKERQQHKSLSVQAYEHFSKGKTPLEVAIILNIGQAQATAYYWEYLKLVQLDDITKIYQELGSGIWDFVKLCKEAKAAKMGVSQVINLLRIANNQLPSVQDKYEQLQKQNNQFESILKTKPKELQDLNSLIAETSKNLDAIKLEYKREAALLQGLQQQTARLEAFVYNYKNNDEEYIKVINSIEKKGTGLLSDKKAFLKLAIFSLIQSMNPLSSTSSNILDMKGSGQVILPTATIR